MVGGGGGEGGSTGTISARVYAYNGFIASAQSSANFYTANIKDVLRTQMDLIWVWILNCGHVLNLSLIRMILSPCQAVDTVQYLYSQSNSPATYLLANQQRPYQPTSTHWWKRRRSIKSSPSPSVGFFTSCSSPICTVSKSPIRNCQLNFPLPPTRRHLQPPNVFPPQTRSCR